MGRDHRGHQLAVALAAALCLALLIAATVIELGPTGDASSGAGVSDASTQGGEKFSASVSGGEDLLDSAFDLVGLDNEGPSRSWEAASLEEGASRLLDEYAQDNACVLAQSGYLDLQGRVWGCVVTGQGWADICVVKQGGSGETAQVLCWRIDQDSAAQGLGE